MLRNIFDKLVYGLAWYDPFLWSDICPQLWVVITGIVESAVWQHGVRMRYSLFLELIPLAFSPSAVWSAICVRPALIKQIRSFEPPQGTQIVPFTSHSIRPFVFLYSSLKNWKMAHTLWMRGNQHGNRKMTHKELTVCCCCPTKKLPLSLSCFWRPLLPVHYKHNETIDAVHEHDRIFIDAILGDLDERRKGNSPEKEQDVGDLINPRQGSRQKEQAKRCRWARKGTGDDEARERVSQSDTEERVAEHQDQER